MSKLFTLVGRLWAWLVPSSVARRASTKELSASERLLLHREHLFGSAVQLLDDEAAAQQVVLEALAQAASQPLLPAPGEGALAAAGADDSAADPPLVSWLDRRVVNLAVTRLQALSAVGVGRGLSNDGWPAVRDSDGPGASADPASAQSGPAGASGSPVGAFPGAAGGNSPTGPGVTAGPGSATNPLFAPPSEQAQLQRTAQVLAQLPTEARVTLMLVVMQGRAIAEVAELLGCSELTCRFWLGHGLKFMRRALQRDLLEDDFVSRESRMLLSPGALNDLRRSKKAAARA